jgi:hypothetical protein
LGAAWSALDRRLLVAMDLAYSMYANATQDLTIVEQYPTGAKTTTAPLDWIDSYAAGLGVEGRVHELVALRAGYGITRSRTAPDAASYFFSPPGWLHSFHAGAGLRLANWDFDLGGYYEFGSKEVDPNRIANPGRYAIHGFAGVLSITFHS